MSIQDYIRNIQGVYDVTYDLDENMSTCGEVIPIFTSQATATAEEQNEQILVRYQFPDAPVAISGFYNPDSDDYDAETSPVLIEGEQYAQEMWSVRFQFSENETTFTGNSHVDFGMRTADGSDVDPDCNRFFNITGLRVSF